jgi:glycosyltransferase involved in cell wall biosynthesis
MLSILIPTFNYKVYHLVSELHKQGLECKIPFEIIVIDDGSNSQTNKENDRINLLDNAIFIALDENIGLSSNRNLLASKAKFTNFLFIDGDSIVLNPNYIKNYLNAIDSSEIIYGGRVHPKTITSIKQKLRWKYGRTVEDKTASQRNSQEYKTLMFNNTLIKKACFTPIQFDPKLKKYGHEDTLFAYQLSLSKHRIKHLDNAVEHGNIEESPIFISKVKNSLSNLLLLDNEHKIAPSFVTILEFYHFLKNYKLDFIIRVFYLVFEKALYKQLVSKNPSLFLFNAYRIGYLCSLKK